MSTKNESQEKKNITLRVKYDDMTVKYANHVILNTTQEEVYLDFSSGMITEPGSDHALMPIHTRIAMTHAGARRLATLLTNAFAGKGQQPAGDVAASGFPSLPPARQ